MHEQFQTTSARGLRHDILPMRLYHKAKRLGIWNPVDIALDTDREHWAGFSELERTVLLHLTALFQAGEESVTLDLLPLMLAVSREGHLEEQMFLTTFLWEEAKHTEFFRRFLDEVTGTDVDLHHFHTDNYRTLFYRRLPEALDALLSDPSPVNQARASVTYNMIVEGVLAETGYHAYYTMLERNGMLPGLREGIGYLKRDESRHIAYGIFLLERLCASHDAVWPAIETTMGELLEPALGVINDLFAAYEEMPFGLEIDFFLSYAMGQFQKRLARIEQARGKSLEAVYRDAAGGEET